MDATFAIAGEPFFVLFFRRELIFLTVSQIEEEERTYDGRTKTGTGSEEEADFRRPATSGPDRQSLFPRSGFLAYTVMHSHPLRKESRVRFPDLTEQFVSARKIKEDSRQSSSLNDSASSRDVSAAFDVETAILGHPVHNQMRSKDGFYAHVFRGPNVVVFHSGDITLKALSNGK